MPASRPASLHLIPSFAPSRAVGRFVLSPFCTPTASGQYAASLSIRSGHGRAAHDRVFRFTPVFATARAATRYAMAQGLDFLKRPALPA